MDKDEDHNDFEIELILTNGDKIVFGIGAKGTIRGTVTSDGNPNEGDLVQVRPEGYSVLILVNRWMIQWLPPKASLAGRSLRECSRGGQKSSGLGSTTGGSGPTEPVTLSSVPQAVDLW